MELKFRGICINTGVMTYGVGIDTQRNTPMIINQGIKTPVIADTVGQFVGLKDKNGIEIYQGDIVKHDNLGLCKVIYDKTEFLLISLDNNQRVCLRGKFNDVIGNIYENPELLEVVK